MKLLTRLFWAAFPLLWILLGAIAFDMSRSSVQAPGYTAQPDVIVEVFDASLKPYSELWRVEVARRFHHAALICAHGGGPLGGVWLSQGSDHPTEFLIPTAQLARRMRERYPDREIVLMVCNPQHLRLGVPNVWYAPGDVWGIPDRAVSLEVMLEGALQMTLDSPLPIVLPHVPLRSEQSPDSVGNIWEFVHD